MHIALHGGTVRSPAECNDTTECEVTGLRTQRGARCLGLRTGGEQAARGQQIRPSALGELLAVCWVRAWWSLVGSRDSPSFCPYGPALPDCAVSGQCASVPSAVER